MHRNRRRRTSRITLALMLALGANAAQAASPAASQCPPYSFLTGNLALNASFEVPQRGVPVGSFTCWQAGDPDFPPSAAKGWKMHTSNGQATICSRIVPPSTAPGPAGTRMLQFIAGGNEGGVYQTHALDPAKSYMFSVWVYVRTGKVAIQSRSMVGGPAAWTTKVGEWEQLRVCTNSLANTDNLVVFNQDPNGGVFYTDRVELREIPTQE